MRVGYTEATLFLAEVDENRPKGAEFGKASPVMMGLFVLLFVAVALLIWDMNRRLKRTRVNAAAEAVGGQEFGADADRPWSDEVFADRLRAARGDAAEAILAARAALPRRIAAYLLDGLVVGAVAYGLLLAAGLDLPGEVTDPPGAADAATAWAIVTACVVAGFVIPESFGVTLGKLVLGLRVVAAGNAVLGAVVRNLWLPVIGAFLIVPELGPAIVVCLLVVVALYLLLRANKDSGGRADHDRMALTKVVPAEVVRA